MLGRKKSLVHVGALVASSALVMCGHGEPESTGEAASAVSTSGANLVLQELNNVCVANQVQKYFQVTNSGTAPVKLSDVVVKFWVDDTSAASIVAEVYTGGCLTNNTGCFHPVQGLKVSATKLSTACGSDPNHQANVEITISNTDSTPMAPGVVWTNLQSTVHLSNWANFAPGTGNWYSECVSGNGYVSPTHSALYVQNGLVTASTGVPPACRATGGSQVIPGIVQPCVLTGQCQLVGPLPGTTPVTVAVSLPIHNSQDLMAQIQKIYDPKSAVYHSYLTPSAFADNYGPSQGTFDQVVGFLQTSGLTVLSQYPGRTVIPVSGTAATMESVFHVTLNQYKRPDGSPFYSLANDPSIDLTIPILSVSGLDNFVMLQPADGSPGAPDTNAGCQPPTNPPAGALFGNDYVGSDFRTAYLGSSNTSLAEGNNQTIALLAYGVLNTADTDQYASTFLSSSTLGTITLKPDGTVPAGKNPVEVALDVDMARAMAPAANIVLYESANPVALLAAPANYVSFAKRATVISNSFLWNGSVPSDRTTLQNIFMQYAIQGQSFLQAAGDYGSYVAGGDGVGDGTVGASSVNGLTVPEPIVDSPLMTVVGGTRLFTGSKASYVQEWAWNNTNKQPGIPAVGGGGLVTGMPLPWYQQQNDLKAPSTSAVHTNLASGSPVRMIPDVSMVADDIAVYGTKSTTQSLFSCKGGTSAATALWAGFVTLMNEQLSTTIGFANPALYQTAAAGSSFNDVTTGNNDWTDPTNVTHGYPATPGYDLATGLGTPKVDLLTSTALPQVCMPGTNLTAVVTQANKSQTASVVAYVPNGSWFEPAAGIRVVALEGQLPTLDDCTPDATNPSVCSFVPHSNPDDVFNTCAGDSTLRAVVCTTNGTNVYVIYNGHYQVVQSLANQEETFSGGRCQTCNVTVNPKTHLGYLSIGYTNGTQSGAAVQPIDITNVATGAVTLGTPFFMGAQTSTSEAMLVDTVDGLLVSPNENNHFQLATLDNHTVSDWTPSISGFGELDGAAMDCTTRIMLSSVEYTNPGQILMLDYNQAIKSNPLPVGGGAWTPNAGTFYVQDFPEFDFNAGTDAIVVAPPSHLGAVAGEYGGDGFGLFVLPFSSGAIPFQMVDYVKATVPSPYAAGGAPWKMGADPHTLTAYTSPINNKQYVVFQNDPDMFPCGGGTTCYDGRRDWLAIIDMQALLYTLVRGDNKTPSSGTSSHITGAAADGVIPEGYVCRTAADRASKVCVVSFVPN